ncbi:hypothetical protein [Cohnella sp. REN36]|uniref:hypothetical protein n=1 Tax=Cohnella sp. REN36 TaxID=2887347 RepID=UPI001D158C07|nr:hypothetical protein [Cohnella sp. REN36]MCC3375088.1 hypothetical protein [Cohnella sp. REN36]
MRRQFRSLLGGIIRLGLMGVCLLFLAQAPTASADWAFRFVVYDGHLYRVTDTLVEPDRIGDRIGEVTRYSDREGTYAGNFSNTFPKGTPYFAIQEKDMRQAIAVRTDSGSYVECAYEGEYAGGKGTPMTALRERVRSHTGAWFGGAAGLLLLALAAAWLLARRSRGPGS